MKIMTKGEVVDRLLDLNLQLIRAINDTEQDKVSIIRFKMNETIDKYLRKNN